MKKLNTILILAILVSSCNNSIDVQEVFFKNQKLFNKLEKPIRTKERYTFEKNTPSKVSIFDSAYLKNIDQFFLYTPCNIVYLMDGDVLVGGKTQTTNLFFTTKGLNEDIELFNFKGSLEYLLKNGVSKTAPYAIKIAPDWYLVKDMESL